jgi:hypothetical protein
MQTMASMNDNVLFQNWIHAMAFMNYSLIICSVIMTSQESNIASKRLLLIFRVMLAKVSTPIYASVS